MLRSVRSEEEEMEEEAAIPPSPRDGSGGDGGGGMDAAFASVEKLEESLKAKGKQKKRP